MKNFKQIREASSKQIHVRMDDLGKDQKKVGDILKKYEKNGSIEFDGETDKGAIFTVKKPAAIATLNRELKPYYTSAQLGEAKGGEIKIVADTNSRKYKEGEVIKTFPETDKGLNQAMVFQKSVKGKFGVDTKMVRESLDEGKDGIDKHPEVRKRYDAMLKTKPDSYERRRAVRAYMNKKKELRREEETDVEEMSALTKIKAKLARAARGPSKKATPAMFRQTGKSARKVRQGAAKSKAYELGRKAREK